MNAASYLEQTHHVTNATAWMITGDDQVAWIQVRDTTCGGVLDPLGCHIRMTRERTHVILHAPPPHPVAHPFTGRECQSIAKATRALPCLVLHP